MLVRPAARLAHGGGAAPAPSRTSPVDRPAPLLLVVSVTPDSPRVQGPDWIRLDGAMEPVLVSRLRERHAPVPALFDVPGPMTPRRSLLTPTEYLVFAAAEEFEWVNLRDVGSAQEIERARMFLPPTTRLTASIHSSHSLRAQLEMLSELCDAVVLHADDLEEELGARTGRKALGVAARHLRRSRTPAILMTRGGPRPGKGSSASATFDHVERQLRGGYRGLVLGPEALATDDPQGSIELIRALLERASAPSAAPRSAVKTQLRRRSDSPRA